MPFTGKNVVITGAAGSLGKAVAAAFAAAGANLALWDIDEEHLHAAYAQPAPAWLFSAVNLLDPDSVSAAANAAMAKFGRIDILCNIAGGFQMGAPVHELLVETWHTMMDLNAGSVINTARAVVPQMIAAGSGKIINIGANSALSGKGGMSAYCASKSAVARLTESMAAELREHGINVNCVLPSILDTPPNRSAMPDANPANWVAPESLAEVILFLASNAARTIHGASIPVVGLS